MSTLPLTEANLKKAMADPRYTNSRHPEYTSWRDKVSQGFATLYPDETLRGDHTDRLERHQGADGNIYASDGTKVASGTIRVRSDTRTVNGEVIEVAAHDRTGGGGTQTGKASPGPATPLPPPTDQPVNPDQMERQLGYDPIGPNDRGNLREHPIDAARAGIMATEATKTARDIYGKDNVELQHGEGDVFRHALWSYMMAKDLSPDTAKAIGDGHERSGTDSTGGRLMDLYNNAVGRDLAKDPANLGRPDHDVIRDAIRDGKLQTRPFQVGGPHGDGPQYRRRY